MDQRNLNIVYIWDIDMLSPHLLQSTRYGQDLEPLVRDF
jgi:hypothetical protein